MPNIRVQNLGASLKILYVDNTDLVRNKKSTYLTEDIVATGTTFRVQSIIGFESLSTSSGQIVCIGELGQERTEILRTSSSTAPGSTYKEVTLGDALQFDHPQETKVYIVDWDKVEFSYSGTATGSKSTFAAYPEKIQADQSETLYRETTKDGVFYFARFNDTLNSRFSNYSDPLYTGGFDDNTVFMIKKRALDEMGEVIDGNLITHEFLNQSLWEARREYHQSPGKRPFRRRFNTIIGTALTGSYRIDLPTDVENPHTAENVYGVRIGANQNMEYYDKKSWDFDWRKTAHSQLALPYTKGTSTSIWLVNGQDFSGSPTIVIEGTNVSATRITGSNNSFTITTHGSWSASGGSEAYENTTLGLPDKFTVFADPGGSAFIYFNKPIDTAYVNMNIYADYYSTLLGFDSDADKLDEPAYDMFVNFLKYKIRARKERGNIPVIRSRTGQVMIADSDYQEWQFKKQDALSTEVVSTDIRIAPEISHLSMPD